MTPEQIIRRPIILTEKATLLREKHNQVIFEVARGANKIEIRDAVQTAFGVRVSSVNTMNRKGKRKRQRKMQGFGQRPDTKRAIVRLVGDDRIELFEG